jgi:hypothetical protein
MPVSRTHTRTGMLVRLWRASAVLLAVAGTTLLLINLIGFALPLRSPDLATAETQFGPDDLTLSYREALHLATRRDNEPNRAFVKRATTAINQGMAHAWTPGTYNLHVPITENWLLWSLGQIHPSFQLWEFSSHHKALERGVGLCSQHAIVLNGLLQAQGLRSEIVSLGQLHVVNRVEIAPGEWIIADADKGVLLPDLNNITPEVVSLHYHTPTPGSITAHTIDRSDAVNYYIQAYQAPIRRSATTMEYNPGATRLEIWSYRLKWFIPILLLAPAVIQLLSRRIGFTGHPGKAAVTGQSSAGDSV